MSKALLVILSRSLGTIIILYLIITSLDFSGLLFSQDNNAIKQLLGASIMVTSPILSLLIIYKIWYSTLKGKINDVKTWLQQ